MSSVPAFCRDNVRFPTYYWSLRGIVDAEGAKSLVEIEPFVVWARDYLPEGTTYHAVREQWRGGARGPMAKRHHPFLVDCPWTTDWWLRDDYDLGVCMTFAEQEKKGTVVQRLVGATKPTGLVVLGHDRVVNDDGRHTEALARTKFASVRRLKVREDDGRIDFVLCRGPKEGRRA